MAMERTLVIIKPDGVQRGLIGEIVSRFERRGLKIVGMKLMQIGPELAARHYAIHAGKPFYPGLIQYITSSPVVVMAIEGKRAIETVRATMGATNPVQAVPGTIRADLGVEIGRNLVHGSDGPETAKVELDLFFGANELVSWTVMWSGGSRSRFRIINGAAPSDGAAPFYLSGTTTASEARSDHPATDAPGYSGGGRWAGKGARRWLQNRGVSSLMSPYPRCARPECPTGVLALESRRGALRAAVHCFHCR